MTGLSITSVSLPLKKPFRISRGVKTHADLVQVTLEDGNYSGRGECCPYSRYGESITGVTAALEALRPDLARGLTRGRLQTLLPPGAARNALDCALWDLEAQKTGTPVYKTLGIKKVSRFETFRTVTIDTPEKMAREGAAYPKGTPLKIKLDQDLLAERLMTIKKACPNSALMVDANEGWTPDFLERAMPVMQKLGVVLIEQPLPAGDDEALREISRNVPVLADEACHRSDDLAGLFGKYDAVNIKLDKTGGLSEAWTMLQAAKTRGFKIMLGCMVSSSLSIAPIAHLCSDADFIDLDGSLLLTGDPEKGLRQIKDTPAVELVHRWGRGRD